MARFENSFMVDTKSEVLDVLPKMKKVVLLNDDYTTMDFVVDVLMSVFDKSGDEALAITLRVHKEGRAVCGIYVYDVAQMKAMEVKDRAMEAGFPLRAMVEEM